MNVLEVPYYPTIEDMKWASERLAERGWGKPKQDVLVDDGEVRGFQIIHRRWPVGVDPLGDQHQNGRSIPQPLEAPPQAERPITPRSTLPDPLAQQERVVSRPALPPVGSQG